jgi:hypothetical protein
MTEARVATCRVRGGAGPRGTPVARAVALTEDALRLAPPLGPRLVVLRRLALGPADRRAMAARAAESLRAAAAGAVHGAAPHAPAAAAVWFRSPEEARRLLLLRLLRGERADAWFWRLAVPVRPPLDAARLLAVLRAEARAAPEAEAALARIVRAAAEAGLLPALAALAPPDPPPPSLDPAAAPPPPPPSEPQAALAALVAAAPEALRRAVAAVLPPRGTAPPAPLWLRRALVLALAPGAAAAPARLATLAAVAASPAPSPSPDALAPPSPAAPAAAPSPPGRAEDPAPQPRPTADRPASLLAPRAAVADPPPDPDRRAPAPAPPPPAFHPDEAFSPVAGVFLLLLPLRRLGFERWLARHPDHALAGFGPALLHRLAAERRPPTDDPVLALLAPPDPPPPEPLLRAWRRQLDRWLRHRAGRRLPALVARPGWITITDEALDLRFPLAAADLRLRRRALDADPGWTPWLGRSVRFHFRDAPLP